MTGMIAVMSEAVYFAAKERGTRVAERALARGVPNAVPYGYRRNLRDGLKTDPERDAKALVPDETTAPVVARIFSSRLLGYGFVVIAKTLNADGIPAPRGGAWVHGTVRTIVLNETYTGVVKLGHRRVEAAHKPLVSAENWRRAQNTKTVIRNGSMKPGIGARLLVCSGCGGPLIMRANHHRRNGGGKFLSYGCQRRSSRGPCPAPTNVKKEAADEFIEAAVRQVLAGESLAAVASSREIDAQRKRVAGARDERDGYVVAASALDVEVFRMGLEPREARLVDEQRRLDGMLARADEAAELPSPSAWDALALDERRRIARFLIDRVIVHPPVTRSRYAPIVDRFELRWRDSAGEDARALR